MGNITYHISFNFSCALKTLRVNGACFFKKKMCFTFLLRYQNYVILSFFSPPQLSTGIVVSVMLKHCMLFAGVWWCLISRCAA